MLLSLLRDFPKRAELHVASDVTAGILVPEVSRPYVELLLESAYLTVAAYPPCHVSTFLVVVSLLSAAFAANDSSKEGNSDVFVCIGLNEALRPTAFENSGCASASVMRRRREIRSAGFVPITPFGNSNSFDAVYYRAGRRGRLGVEMTEKALRFRHF